MNVLKFISALMNELNIPYEFGTWTQSQHGTTLSDPYFVGEYNEVESVELEENGYQESTFILTGTGTSWIELERAKETIKTNLPKTSILTDHAGIGVFYGHSLVVPTGDAELKRIQINLQIKEWSVI